MSFMSHIGEFFGNVSTIGLAISLLLSLAGCFFGYKLMKVWIAVAGFVIGFVLGDVVCALLRVHSYGIFFLIGAVVGIVLAIVSFKFYKVGIFLLGAVLGGGIAMLVFSVIGLVWWHIPAAAAIGAAVGALTLLCSKPVVILGSAISGGLSALKSAGGLFIFAALTENSPTFLQELAANASVIMLWGGIALAAAGVAVQFITNQKKAEEKTV